MSDDLVKRLRGGIGNTAVVTIAGCMHSTDCLEAADRIEELEAKLAKAVEALKEIKAADRTIETPSDYARGWNHGRFRYREIARAAIAEINGGGDT